MLATGFSVLLGFIVFLAFETYDGARVGAEIEALTVAQQVETAQFLPESVAGELTGELICYGIRIPAAEGVVRSGRDQHPARHQLRARQPAGRRHPRMDRDVPGQRSIWRIIPDG